MPLAEEEPEETDLLKTLFLAARTEAGFIKNRKVKIIQSKEITFFFIMVYDTLELMRNKIGLIIVVLFFSIILSGCEKTENPIVPTTSPPSPTAVAVKTVNWEDPAGFVFEYPEGLKINNHPEDKINYANLEITDPQEDGKILIMAKDTKYANVETWVKTDKEIKAGKIEEALLAQLEAKKIILENGKIIVGTIDQAILFTVEGDFSKSQKLTGAFEKIIESFKMVIPEVEVEEAAPSGNSGGLDIEEISEDEE